MTNITIQEGQMVAVGDSKILLDYADFNSRKSFVHYTWLGQDDIAPVQTTLHVGQQVELMPQVKLTLSKLIRRQSLFVELEFSAPTDISIVPV